MTDEELRQQHVDIVAAMLVQAMEGDGNGNTGDADLIVKAWKYVRREVALIVSED